MDVMILDKSHLVDLGVSSDERVVVDWGGTWGVWNWLVESSADIVDDIAPVAASRLGFTNFSHVATKSLGVLTPFTWKNLENADPVKVKLASENPLGFPSVNLN